MNRIANGEFKRLFLDGRSLLDVRAPIEFKAGAAPGAVNLPLLNDNERHEIGLLYKKEGSDAAVARGNILVSGDIKKSRLQAWKDHFKKNPEGALYCFRGGLRSQTVQDWLRAEGIDVPLIEGGYKALRRYLMQAIDESLSKIPFLVVAGPTGAGKSTYLREPGRRHLDLEALALHRGSAFGALEEPQPAQTDFENRLAVALLRLQDGEGPVYVEDESRLIGKIVLPVALFDKIQSAPIHELTTPLEKRVENIFLEYVQESSLGRRGDLRRFVEFENAVQAISRKLGGARSVEVLADVRQARVEFSEGRGLKANRVWIEKLLVWYYDPLYERALKRRRSR
jgi:tRNA 2-selenouridine synthase